jgi:hypothetical protein
MDCATGPHDDRPTAYIVIPGRERSSFPRLPHPEELADALAKAGVSKGEATSVWPSFETRSYGPLLRMRSEM